ncbi:hypothetical protein GCM10009530_43020 [Microbispora corallina]|uniref:Histidine kinase/HSP90-like ATPase domain-containing protein n=1 Tax=Microbispora corallina TaxID=83302 RepID=A0ABQ4G141_9ACTN|nr:ATP-binding protein [Microbispora corallina]GIH40769.1 hypothetical protein Mco01_37690 [Microbispora corallina]
MTSPPRAPDGSPAPAPDLAQGLAPRPGFVPVSGAARAESALVLALSLYRLYGLSQVAVAVWLDGSHYPRPVPVLALAAAVFAESLAVIAVCVRRRAIPSWLISADVVFCTAGLFLCAALTVRGDGHTWIYFMYPFTVVTSVAVGFGYRRLAAVIAATLLLCAGYVAAAIVLHHDPFWNVVPNAVSYLANTTVGWAAARYLRRSGTDLDRSRVVAVERADALARERERARHARILHDRVLQTLETLARGEWVSDEAFRAHIAGEAAWLRALVEGVHDGDGGDLPAGLQRLVRDKARTGLRVDLNSASVRDVDGWPDLLPPDRAAALVEAANEALTNVAKHSGVSAATMRVHLRGAEVVVTVHDRGRGFSPGEAVWGMGLRESIGRRMREVGGHALVDSAPGAGTFVELRAPFGRAGDRPGRAAPGSAASEV